MCVCVCVCVCVDLQTIFLYIHYPNLPSLFPIFKRTQSKPHKTIIVHYGNKISYSLVVSYIYNFVVVLNSVPLLFSKKIISHFSKSLIRLSGFFQN